MKETATWREQSCLQELRLHFLCISSRLLFPQAERVEIVGTMPRETLFVASGKLQFLFAFANALREEEVTLPQESPNRCSHAM